MPTEPANSLTRIGRPIWLGRLARASLVAGAATCLVGCASPAGPVFTPLATPLLFPPPPDEPRIAYVGAIGTDADLKAGKSPLDSLGEAIFGASSINSMLSPFAICTVGSKLYVCDTNAQVVHVFDLETRAYRQLRPTIDGKGEFNQPVGITSDPDGRLWVSDSVAGRIHFFDPRGTYLGAIGEGTVQRPTGIRYDAANGRLFVADTGLHQVLVLSPDGTLLARVGERGSQLGQFNFPTNVALDSAGRLYVSDTLNFRVQVFDSDLKPLRQIGRQGDMPGYFSQPKGIALDSEDHLYVVDSHFEAVQVFDSEGRLLMTFGDEGSGPGQFWLPAGITIDLNDRIWIADSYNRRVQVFDYLRPAQRGPVDTPVDEVAPQPTPSNLETRP